VHVLGAGPVGLLITALLQSMDGMSVHLYEKRPAYTRTRMVTLAQYLVADSVAGYRTDDIDGESVDAIFDPAELVAGLAGRRAIPSDLMSLLQAWALGFCPLNTIERTLSDLIDGRGSDVVVRDEAVVTVEEAIGMLEPGDVLIDCTGSRSLLRDQLMPGSEDVDGVTNTLNVRLEYALVITFLYGQLYDCNESCKYFKNAENEHYKFIPAVHRTYYDGATTHVTGIVNISAEEFAAMPSTFDGEWLRGSFPSVARSMDRFIDKIKEETHGEVLGTSRSSGSPWICIGLETRRAARGATRGPPTIRSPERRCSYSAMLRSVLPTSSRSRWGSSARCSWRDSSSNGTSRSTTCSIGTSCTSTSSGSASTCGAR
jgi:threonine dehydrogenase-like Zn-dependent dehydrogenase